VPCNLKEEEKERGWSGGKKEKRKRGSGFNSI
jgi:hypothetical protein